MSMKVYLGMKVDDLKQKFARRGEKKERIDDDLPLNLRLGSRVQLSEAPFLLAGDESLVSYPGEESLVGAFSRVKVAGLDSYRLYLKDREDSSQESMLMLLMNDHGDDVDEIYLFREQHEIPLYYTDFNDMPEDGDEENAVEFWIGKNEGILGMPVFHTPEELSYERLWGSDEDVRVPPPSADEKMFLDPLGDEVMGVEHLATMLYARTFEGMAGDRDEYLMPTVEKDDEGFRVRIWVGVPLNGADIDLPDAL